MNSKTDKQTALDFLSDLAKHGFEYFIGGISALVFLYGILGKTSVEVDGNEMLALLFLGGLGILLAVFSFVVKQIVMKSRVNALLYRNNS